MQRLSLSYFYDLGAAMRPVRDLKAGTLIDDVWMDKAYFKAATNDEPLPSNRNLGSYLKKLEDLKAGDAKVIAVLTQIKDLHRNPLMHPEETLDRESAIGLFGIVISAVSAMLIKIPNAPVKDTLKLADGTE